MVVRWFTQAAQVVCLLLSAMFAPIACSAQTNNASSVVAWERGLAESGDPIYQTKIGLRYRSGEGVQKNEVEAAKWFRAAAEQGDATRSPSRVCSPTTRC
jgi:TPR repeat protein